MPQRRFSITKFKDAWASDRDQGCLAAEFGVSTRAIQDRAKHLGLPSRRHRQRRKQIAEKTMVLMLDMRAFGLTLKVISGVVGLPQSVVRRNFEWQGLPRYPRYRTEVPTLADYHEHQFAKAMASSAAQTRRALATLAEHDAKIHPKRRYYPKRVAAEGRAA